MEIISKWFDQLSTLELYEILQLRSQVFVVEQNCVYQDIDGKDEQALHIIGTEDGRIIGYARCFPPKIYFEEAAIGRVIVRQDFRDRKLGHEVLKAAVNAVKEHYETDSIRLSAQLHLTRFYECHGFKSEGSDYLEDGIPHINMVRK